MRQKWAPAGTPAETVDKLSKDIGHVLQTADMRDWFKQHEADVMIMTLILMGYGSGCQMRKLLFHMLEDITGLTI